MNRTHRRSIVTFLLASLWVLGCGPGSSGPSSSGEATPAATGTDAKPVPGGTARIGILQEPTTFLDWFAKSKVDLMMADLVFRRLAQPGPTPGSLIPDLASSWETRVDGRSLVFHLRPGMRWEDGREVNSADAVFSFERAISYGALPKQLDRLEVQGDRDVVFHFRSPYPEMLADAAGMHVYPKHILEPVPLDALRNHPFQRKPLGSGPFRLERWEPGQYLSFVPWPRPEHAAEDEGPFLERLVVNVFPDKAAAVRELEAGGLDLLRKVPKDTADRLEAARRFRVFRIPSREYVYVLWNARRWPLSLPQVRRAMTAAIDRRAIAIRFEGPDGRVAEGPVPFDHGWYDPSLTSPAYDPARVAQELAAAGLHRSPEGRWVSSKEEPIRLQLLTDASVTLQREVGALLADSFRRLGIDVERREVETPLARAEAGDFDAILFSQADSSVNLRDSFGTAGTTNHAGFSDAELDRLIDGYERENDAARARSTFRMASRRVVELQPWTFLFYRGESSVFSKRLRGIEANPRDPIAAAEFWWIAPGDR